MAVGTQASVSGIDSSLTGLAISLRDLAGQITNLSLFMNNLEAAGLEALGFTSGDATTALSMISYLNTIAGVYLGTATQGSEFDFNNELSVLWGGA